MKLKEKSKGFITEFKQFIQRGNAFDMAVAVVIGTAFNSIVTSLVNDIMMPLIAAIMGEHDFTSLSFTLNNSVISYGAFIEKVIDFLVVAFCIFVFIKLMNSVMKKKEEPKKEEEPKKSDEVLLLEEIRDLMKKQNKTK